MKDSFFPNTRWSLIQGIRGGRNDRDLEEWCKSYWLPIRKYICSCGYSISDAEEFSQMFFEKLLSKSSREMLPSTLQGAFRAYLKRSVKNFLIDQWRAKHTQTREGGKLIGELNDEIIADSKDSPDVAFDKAWLLNIISNALDTLKQECIEAGKEEVFEVVAPLLDDKSVSENRQELADQLGLSDTAFRMMLSRMRQRFSLLIEREIRETISNREEFDEEVRYLMSIWT